MLNTGILNRIFPFLGWMGEVNRHTLRQDAFAGLTGAIIVLPQGIAFAEIAGMPPVYGLYTAMITPIVAALFGSSRHLISGPTTAISLVIFSAISVMAQPKSEEFIALVLAVTLLAGIIQFVLGLARLGTLVNFVSHSVVVGFTAGAAILIATSQIKHVLGIAIPDGAFIYKIGAVVTGIGATNLYVLLVAMTTLFTAILVKKFWPNWPNLLMAMVVGGLLTYLIDGVTKGVVLVGELPAHLPPLHIPTISSNNFGHLLSSAFAIALLGLIEAVAIGRSIAAKSHQRINGNQEFIGQGLSNIVGSFFSCYAGSGSFTRSGINYMAGAKTPLAAVFAAGLLMLVLLLIAPLTAYLPIPAMGGIVLLVSYNLIDWVGIKHIFKASPAEAVVFSTTMLATLFLDLEYAIYIGVVLSLIFFFRSSIKPRALKIKKESIEALTDKQYSCPRLMIYKLTGPVYFGVVNKLSDELSAILRSEKKDLLLIADEINMIDMAGAETLEVQDKFWKEEGVRLYFCGLRSQYLEFLKKGKYMENIGDDAFFSSIDEALMAICERQDNGSCELCDENLKYENMKVELV